MERTLIFGILLFMILFVLNSKLTIIAKKSMFFKLGLFFSILTLLFLAVGGINDEFSNVSVVTFILAFICLSLNFVQNIVKIFKGKIDVTLAFCFCVILICELYTRLDPYGSFLYFIFNKSININRIEIYSIIIFIILLSAKVFAGIFFKKDLNFLNKKHFEVKDGKGK